MAVQNGGLNGRGPAPYVDRKTDSNLTKTRQFLFSGDEMTEMI